MRFSKKQLLQKAAVAFGMAVFFHLFNFDLVAVPCFIVTLGFLAWVAQKLYRDHLLGPNTPSIREVRADYHRPPELMSKGSRGLPTNFD